MFTQNTLCYRSRVRSQVGVKHSHPAVHSREFLMQDADTTTVADHHPFRVVTVKRTCADLPNAEFWHNIGL